MEIWFFLEVSQGCLRGRRLSGSGSGPPPPPQSEPSLWILPTGPLNEVSLRERICDPPQKEEEIGQGQGRLGHVLRFILCSGIDPLTDTY